MQSSTNADLEAAFGLGVHTVEFTVTDKAGGSASASAGFEVLDDQPQLNLAPVLASISNQSMPEGGTLNIPLSATDPDPGDSLAFSASGLPSFCSLTDNGNRSGSIACNPVGGDSGTFNVTVTVTDDGSPALSDSDTFDLAVISQMGIDIKPGRNPNAKNRIELDDDDKIKVAILSSLDFDALQVDPASVQFGPAGASPIRYRAKDTNRDGLQDLLLVFRIRDTGIACGDTEATLTGEKSTGGEIQGSDSLITEDCGDDDDGDSDDDDDE